MVCRPWPVLLILPLVALADSECSSLLTLSERKDDWNSGSFHTDAKGTVVTCTEESGGKWTKKHYNTLNFMACARVPDLPGACGLDAPPAHIVSMVPASYAITKGQPVDSNCFSTTPSSFTFFAGRKGSSGARDAFMSGLNSDNIMVDQGVSSVNPDKLNFMLEGDISFTVECDHSYGPELSAKVRFGQGHFAETNNWWVGGTDCQSDKDGLHCGPLTFISSSNSDKFWLRPSVSWEAYCNST